jgi:hypothetical protein
MLVRKLKFINFCFVFVLVVFTSISNAQSNEWGDDYNKAIEEIETMENRIKFIESYLLNVKNLSTYEKSLLRDSFDLKVRIYLLSENKKSLRNISTEVYNNTLCLARSLEQRAMIYINAAIGQVFKTEEEMKRYLSSMKYLESLETPIYTENEVNEICNM